MQNKDPINPGELAYWKERMDFSYVTILSDDYPEQLKNIQCPPFVLYYKGDYSIIHERFFSMVGMRQASDYGISMALYIADLLAKNHIGVVSGMAKGIDAYSHIGCMNVNGHTIAVLGCGINYCYPKQNKGLYERLCKEQLVISEYPFALPPKRDYFPKRNRIVAGLGEKIIVVETKQKGGSMISVGFALDQGKDVICVPQRYGINDGCNYLIGLGAKILVNPDDLF